MNPWVVIDQATVPGDGGEMKLLQRTHEFTINVKNEELMNSRLHGSEDALAELTCKPLASRRRPRVLIGGLGMAAVNLMAYHNHITNYNLYGDERTKFHLDVQA